VTRQNGALRILLYNWPVYAGTWIAALSALLVASHLRSPLAELAALAGGAALAWSLGSLIVSHCIYDRSRLVSGRWVVPLLGSSPGTLATIHAGLDAEVDLDAVMPGRCVARLDIFDPAVMTSPSIHRARVRTLSARPATPSSPTALALDDEACDAVVVAFTAHEIRSQPARERFFDELRRSLRRGGRVLIVEHLRDAANFLAFGPGYLHFVPRREWMRLARHAGLEVAAEARITPWVMALVLERPP
jgi:SAM-dependent methyltransferase